MSNTNNNLWPRCSLGGEVFADGAISLICTQQAEQKLHTVAANLRFHAKRTVANRLWPFSHCLLSCSSMSSRHLVPKAVDVFYFCSVIYESHDGNGAGEYRPQGDAVEWTAHKNRSASLESIWSRFSNSASRREAASKHPSPPKTIVAKAHHQYRRGLGQGVNVGA